MATQRWHLRLAGWALRAPTHLWSQPLSHHGKISLTRTHHISSAAHSSSDHISPNRPRIDRVGTRAMMRAPLSYWDVKCINPAAARLPSVGNHCTLLCSYSRVFSQSFSADYSLNTQWILSTSQNIKGRKSLCSASQEKKKKQTGGWCYLWERHI